MDFPTVQAQLNDLPPTFKRSTTPFTNWTDAVTAGLTRLTGGADGVSAMLTCATAQYGWLDTWGLIFGFPRNMNEADSVYLARILFLLSPGIGTPNVITNYIYLVYGVVVSVVETFAPGYTITFPASVTLAQISTICQNLARIRPAGVPFQVYVQGIGPYLDTVNYLNAGRITGAYLNTNAYQVYPTFLAGTPNSPPLIPTLFLTDPTLN